MPAKTRAADFALSPHPFELRSRRSGRERRHFPSIIDHDLSPFMRHRILLMMEYLIFAVSGRSSYFRQWRFLDDINQAYAAGHDTPEFGIPGRWVHRPYSLFLGSASGRSAKYVVLSIDRTVVNEVQGRSTIN